MPSRWIVVAVFACAMAAAGCCSLPTPNAPPAKPNLDCSFPSTGAATPLPGGPIAGGTFSSASSLTIGPTQTFDLTSDLVIWSDGDLTIDGDIAVAPAGPGAPSVNISLGARRKVTINGRVGGGYGAAGAPATGTAAIAGAGGNGGYIKVVGGSVDIAGSVVSVDGGDGGNAAATGVITSSWYGNFGGDADAVGGSGGHGGDIILCGDAIKVGGIVRAGAGGFGGQGAARAAAGAEACACGGDGGAGGNVIVGPGTQLDVGPAGWIAGGSAWRSGNAVASVAPGRGGRAEAMAGAAAPGGSVQFGPGATAISNPPPVNGIAAGGGGRGGHAEAYGGDGGSGWLWPDAGGDAKANAANGAPAGPTPVIPLPAGATINGRAGAPGPGGDAKARGGDGGASTGWGGGAASGSSSATGGANGAGVAPTGGTTYAAPVKSTTPAGGVAGTASQTGAL